MTDTTHRVLVLTEPGTSSLAGRIDREAAEILVVVPALASNVEALTGAVDDRRADAQETADRLAAELVEAGLQARGVVGADAPLQAVEDSLREFGADEIVFAMGDDALLEQARERLALPVSRV
jgi:hypothetical protein